MSDGRCYRPPVAGSVKQSVVSVCPSLCQISCEPNDLWRSCFAHLRVMAIGRWEMKVESMRMCVCCMSIYLGVFSVLIVGSMVCLHFDVINYHSTARYAPCGMALPRPAAAAAANSSVVGLWVCMAVFLVFITICSLSRPTDSSWWKSRIFLWRVQSTEYRDRAVQAGRQYEYRVTAVGAGGTSDFSETSGSVRARPLKGSPPLRI